MIYLSQISNKPITSRAYCPDTVWYQIIDTIWQVIILTWANLSTVNTESYLFCYASAEHQACLASVIMNILERLRTKGRPNSPDMPPKRNNSDQNRLTGGGLRQLQRNLITSYLTTQYTAHSTCRQVLLVQPSSPTSERLLENLFCGNHIQYLLRKNNLDVSS